jgi:sugar/nucleoside kinase (ribokinase family)
MPKQSTPKKISDLSVLVVGTTCCDMTNPGFDFLNDIAGDGLVVDSRRMVAVRPEWLAQRKDSYAMGGGSLNIAPLISLAGVPVGILTSLGRENEAFDIHGQFMFEIMEKTGVFPIIIPHETLPSAASFIRPAQPGRREAILHAPNASDELDIERQDIFEKITQLPPGSIVHYVYSGATRTMDAEQGRKLGRVMERLKKLGYITMVDPHTLSKDPKESIRKKEVIEGYKLLKPVLPHLSFFFASQDEAMMIANTFGYSLKGRSQKEKNFNFLRCLVDDYALDRSPRIFGITTGTEINIMYASPHGKQIGPLTVKSRYAIAEAQRFVGAGDSFRAGFEVEWAKNKNYLKKSKAGELEEADLERLCLMGHLMAACYVTRTPSNQYGNIPGYRHMKNVVNSGKNYSKKEALLSALKIFQRKKGT